MPLVRANGKQLAHDARRVQQKMSTLLQIGYRFGEWPLVNERYFSGLEVLHNRVSSRCIFPGLVVEVSATRETCVFMTISRF